ncbi:MULTISPECIES: transglycosylase domain-containing protein [Clostridium]|jgi:penicillin-binding protein 1A|uniref:transglycosylase domain-containing protein n=1 Tax=Clostridium TaxID=1485 RepID=UPI00019AFC2E|nr:MULTISPECIES: PBP1A family penicillin-binding protein [Clostridium]EEH97464.1 1A family penicillin-binding protein [Clostridium sp. 7_2_43FAA]MBU6134961.1 PBP1A family penicillin-binding protein [Clostridium tertium]MDI9216356.1 PBP1A family penicillin-binding protein [Clostridium tertium]MDU2682215.1 PBP1A family penicillin-binding protein [Clostridium sp.]MDU8964643.1 PBP1A family penicillin-binding protein [Clostridium sp.]
MATKDTSRTEKSQANVKKNKNSGKNSKKKKNQPKYKKILKGTFLGILIAGLLCFVVGLGYVFAIIKSTEPLDVNAVLTLNEPSMIYDSEGQYIDNLPTQEERYKVKLDEMSKYLKDAYISIEDERFYKHPGVDIKRTLGSALRSAKYFFTGSGNVQGGSTLTQQLIKNTLLTNDVKIERKIREIYLSLKLESKLTKDQILEAYLNTIPLGGKIYGVEAASKYYFEKSAKDLTLPEAAFIAGLTQAPSAYSPYDPENIADPTIYLDRTKTVLMKMRDLGYITQEEYDEAYAFTDSNQFAFSQTVINYKINYEWFVYPALDQVRRDLKDVYKYTDEEVDRLFATGGLKIYTTMDRKIQDSTQAVLNDRNSIQQLDIYANPEVTDENGTPALQAAAVIMDYRTGQIKAMVGGRGEQPARSTNRAYYALRSIGSTTKPLTVYGPAIDTKTITAGTVLDDAGLPSSIQSKYGGYNPANWNKVSDGLITARQSLALSKNVPTVLIEDKLGIETGLAYGEKLGLVYSEESKGIATISLGEFTEAEANPDGGNPYILASAFGSFGNNGLYTEPILYTKVVDATGKVILEPKLNQTQVFSPQTAYIMRDLLKGPLSFDGSLAKIPNMPVIGKTGTTSNVTDFLFAGLTPYYSGAVWIGYDNRSAMGGASYSSSAASLWGAIMAPIHENLEYKEFDGNPGGVTSVAICKDSGKRPTDLCNKDPRGSRVYNELFIAGTEPTGVCDVHVTAKVNKNNNKLATENTPKNLIEERVFIKKANPSSGTADYQYVLPTEKDDTKYVPKNEAFNLSDLGITIGSNADDAIELLKSKGVNVKISNNDAKTRIIKSLSADKAKKGDTITIELKDSEENNNGENNNEPNNNGNNTNNNNTTPPNSDND